MTVLLNWYMTQFWPYLEPENLLVKVGLGKVRLEALRTEADSLCSCYHCRYCLTIVGALHASFRQLLSLLWGMDTAREQSPVLAVFRDEVMRKKGSWLKELRNAKAFRSCGPSLPRTGQRWCRDHVVGCLPIRASPGGRKATADIGSTTWSYSHAMLEAGDQGRWPRGLVGKHRLAWLWVHMSSAESTYRMSPAPEHFHPETAQQMWVRVAPEGCKGQVSNSLRMLWSWGWQSLWGQQGVPGKHQ